MKLQRKNSDMAIELNDLICVYDEVLSRESCDKLINFFEISADKQEKIENDAKPNFTQVNLTEHCKISDDIDKLHTMLISSVFAYKKKYYELVDSRCFPEKHNFEQFRIKKYDTSGEQRFDTHVDVQDYSTARRFLSFLFYLNDVDSGGETLFEGMTIQPRRGRLLVFPPLWMYPHKGCAPISNEKYIISTYLHFK
jgi:hypothetical protein